MRQWIKRHWRAVVALIAVLCVVGVCLVQCVQPVLHRLFVKWLLDQIGDDYRAMVIVELALRGDRDGNPIARGSQRSIDPAGDDQEWGI